MKPFNKALHDDIFQLKHLHALKDKKPFREILKQIQHHHGISRATVYREMKKDTPGLYNAPNYNPPSVPVTHKEKLMVGELLRTGMPIGNIIKKMSKELRIPYTRDRLDKARLMAEQLDEPEDTNRTVFASGGKFFLQELFCLPYMAYGKYAEVHVNGEKIKVTREAFDDIILILTRENPADTEDPLEAELKEEIITNTRLLDLALLTLENLCRNPERSTSFAVTKLEEKIAKLRKEKKSLAQKKKYLLHRQKLGGVKGFYAEEWLNDPSEYDPYFADPEKEADIDERVKLIQLKEIANIKQQEKNNETGSKETEKGKREPKPEEYRKDSDNGQRCEINPSDEEGRTNDNYENSGEEDSPYKKES